MNIAFFISDHGFGHMMRELPIIKYFLERNNSIVVVCNKRCNELAKEYLADELVTGNIEFVDKHTDEGITVIPGTLQIDEFYTAANVKIMQNDYPQLESFARKLLNENRIDKVVVDIVPWAIKAAKEFGIETFLMLSFTWLDQYGHCIDNESRHRYIDYFKMADHFLYYDLCNKNTRELLKGGENVGFVCRGFHVDKVQEIRRKHEGRKIVFLSLGGSNSGLDFEIDINGLDYDFVTTDVLKLRGDNVEYIPANTCNTQDYIKAADYCISKPGWTTVSEIMLAGTKTALLKRPDVKEDSLTIDEMVKRKTAVAIDVDELKDMGNVMSKLEKAPWNQTKYKNNIEGLAKIIEGSN